MTSDRSKGLGREAQALARRECGVISRALSLGRHPNAAIHRGRKAIRRLRALLALLEHRFDGLATADRKLQRLGDSLSTLRDAHVAVDVAQSIAARDASVAWQPMIERLVRRRDDLIMKALAQDPSFKRRRAIMKGVAADIDALDWKQLKHKDLREGIEAGRARVAKAEKRAKADPSAENCHRFRRRLRRLRMQLEASKAIAPDLAKSIEGPPSGSIVKSLRRSSDRLGRLQDLRSLQNLVRRAPDIPQRPELLVQLKQELKPGPPSGSRTARK